ncbi:MAG: right-handed parallel beta-helix repeat-containing protein, partial [Candidatus Thorarchaeota archaeon]
MKRLVLIISILFLLTSPALAGTAYYVDCSQGSNGTGTFASPWNTIESVNDASMSTGDDVYFKENTTCSGAKLDNGLVIDWTGTSGDRVVIGCYDGDGDFNCDNVVQSSITDQKPELDGNFTYPSSWALIGVGHGVSPGPYFGSAECAAGDCAVLEDAWQAATWNTNALAGGIVQNKTDGSECVIESNTAETITCVGSLSGGAENDWDDGDDYLLAVHNYITIKDLKISESNDKGINFGDSDYGLIDNVYVYRSWNHGIVLGRSHDTTVSDSVVDGAGYYVADEDKSADACIVSTGAHSLDSCNNNLITRNRISNCYREGIGIYQGAHTNTIEYNIVYDVEGPSIYSEASKNNTIRYNLIYSTGSGETGDGRSYSGVEQITESARCSEGGGSGGNYGVASDYNSDTKVYGNLISGMTVGIIMGGSGDADCNDQDDNLVYGNTVVDSATNYSTRSHSNYSGNLFKNNISANYYGSSNEIDNCSATGWTFANNLWDGTESGNCTTTAQNNADPGLAKTSLWRTVAPTLADFALLPTSDAIDNGADLGATYDDTITPLIGDLATLDATIHDQDNYGAGWEIGGSLFYDDTAPTVTDPTADETGWDYTTPDTMDMTHGGTGTHYATHWKVVFLESDCVSGAAQGTETSCDTSTPTAHPYAGLGASTSYKLCIWSIEDLDGGSDCDSWEESLVATQSFETQAGGLPAGTHETPDNSAYLYDSDAGWTPSELVGYTVTNTGDDSDSSCTILTTNADTITCT